MSIRMRFDHLGVVVKSLDKGRSELMSCLNVREWTEEFDDVINGVRLQFGRDPSGMCYELLEPRGPDSPVAAALKTKRTILNHVAYLVANLDEGRASLERQGCVATSGPKPAIAYGGSRIQFFVNRLHFVIELIEAPTHQHVYR